MAVYTVDSDAVFTTTDAARATAERIQLECAALHAQLGQLQSVWTGQASSAFGVAAERWRLLQDQVSTTLGDLSAALGIAGQHYLDAESSSAHLFR